MADVLGAERAVGPPGEDPADPQAPKHLLVRQPLVRHGVDEPERLPAVEAEMGRELGAGEHAAVQEWTDTPAKNPRYRGMTPGELARLLLHRPKQAVDTSKKKT